MGKKSSAERCEITHGYKFVEVDIFGAMEEGYN